jgi:hypothetical protein
VTVHGGSPACQLTLFRETIAFALELYIEIMHGRVRAMPSFRVHDGELLGNRIIVSHNLIGIFAAGSGGDSLAVIDGNNFVGLIGCVGGPCSGDNALRGAFRQARCPPALRCL